MRHAEGRSQLTRRLTSDWSRVVFVDSEVQSSLLTALYTANLFQRAAQHMTSSAIREGEDLLLFFVLCHS